MKILNKLGHREASIYLIDTCKELTLGANKSVDGYSLVSSDSLCAKVGSQSAWWRDVSAAIRPLDFDPSAAEARLSGLRLVDDDKNVSDFLGFIGHLRSFAWFAANCFRRLDSLVGSGIRSLFRVHEGSLACASAGYSEPRFDSCDSGHTRR